MRRNLWLPRSSVVGLRIMTMSMFFKHNNDYFRFLKFLLLRFFLQKKTEVNFKNVVPSSFIAIFVILRPSCIIIRLII